MHFIIQRDKFVQSVQHVNKAVSSRTTIPILTGIKLEVTSDGVTLTGSDSDISIESFIPAADEEKEYVEVKKEGSIVLQARFFADIVKKLPGDDIEVMVQDQFATTLRSGSVVFNLNGLDPEEYPQLPKLDESRTFRLPQNLLKDMIRQTVFAVSNQETRPVLTGVNMEIENGILTCTATDSHRLAMRKAITESTTENLTISNVVIPGKSLNELSKILDDTDDLVDIVVTGSQILFQFKHLLFFSRLLDGKYPVTKNMIPEQAKTQIELPTKELLHSLERALLLSKEAKNNVINLKTLEGDVLEVTSISSEVGKVTEKIHCHQVEGEELRISFNGKNIMDALKVIDSEMVHIMFTGAMSPFILRPTDHDQMLHLFSPVRTY
ncbi:DNA polymerase III, beta subunit [Alteribacillus persepolensis]|uniref:Beta sliding clamp n=1 Tax=Alteribacillus persepolensis TaxID=568899 RepID=A0A1G8IYZ0_9BACI|nr:DNA polymerase III subunit beta [Alteribacillus persepolensis]SDI23947.1 DNA polymerase III, beta subunit [Alteribacillus persepolensis]